MSRVTKIEPQKKKQARFNIFIDEKFAFGASAQTIADFGLVPDKSISKREIDQILKKEELLKFQDAALKFLNWRPRSEKEVRDYLTTKVAKKENVKFRQAQKSPIIDKIITKLKKYKFIDDRLFAKWFVDSRGKRHQKSKRLVTLELRGKGIAKEIIDSVVQSGYDDHQIALVAVAKKVKRWQKLPEIAFRKKIYQYLLMRGFGYETAKEVFAYYDKNR